MQLLSQCPITEAIGWFSSSFDQLAEIVDAVGDKVDVICDGGIRRVPMC